MLLSCTGCKSNDYAKANKLFENEDYEAALKIYSKLGDYEDCASQSEKCHKKVDYDCACKKMDSGDFGEAVKLFAGLGDYEDSVKRLHSLMYDVIMKDDKFSNLTSDGISAYLSYIVMEPIRWKRSYPITIPAKFDENDTDVKKMTDCATELESEFNAYRRIFTKELIADCDMEMQKADAAYEKAVTDYCEFFTNQFYDNLLSLFGIQRDISVTEELLSNEKQELRTCIDSFKLN